MARRKNPLSSHDVADLRQFGPAAGLSEDQIEAVLEELSTASDFTDPGGQAWAVNHLTDLALRALAVQSWTTPDEMRAHIAVARIVLRVVKIVSFDLSTKVR